MGNDKYMISFLVSAIVFNRKEDRLEMHSINSNGVVFLDNDFQKKPVAYFAKIVVHPSFRKRYAIMKQYMFVK